MISEKNRKISVEMPIDDAIQSMIEMAKKDLRVLPNLLKMAYTMGQFNASIELELLVNGETNGTH